MKYKDYPPEKHPIAVACKLVEAHGFEHRVRRMRCDEAGCSGPFVDVVVLCGGPFLFWRRAWCYAVIEPTWRDMRIYGDEHKETMLQLAQELEKELQEVPDGFQECQLDVEFLSHEPKAIWCRR